MAPALLENALLLRSNPLRLFSRLAETGEPVSRLDLPAGRSYLVNQPELVAQLLLDRTGAIQKYLFPGILQAFGSGIFNSRGSIHATVRQAALPVFHRLNVETSSEQIRAMAGASLRELGKGEVDLKTFFERMTLQIVGRILFGLDLSNIAADFFDCAERMQQSFQQIEASPVAADRFAAASTRIDQLLRDALERQPRVRGDGMLFRALDATGQLSPAQMLEEVRSFLMASMPTSLLLAAACWLLAKHPEEQIRIRGGDGGVSLENFTQETLRLYPPAWLLIREAVAPLDFAGIHCPAGTAFLVCLWTLHRSPRFFSDPDRFWPGRWDKRSELPRGAYIPFSLGPRSCLGERLSRMIAQHALLPLLRQFQLSASEHPDPEWLPRITFAPRTGIWVRLQRHPAS